MTPSPHLYVREINCGTAISFWDGGIKPWIGDAMNGHHSETTSVQPRQHGEEAGQWLVDEAARHFPKGVSGSHSSGASARPAASSARDIRQAYGLPAPRATGSGRYCWCSSQAPTKAGWSIGT